MPTQLSVSQTSIKMCIALFVIISFALLTLGCGSDSDGLNNPQNPFGAGPATVSLASSGGAVTAGDLGAAGNYVILAKTGISNVTGSAVTGNIAVSPAAATYLTGFSLIAHSSDVYSTSSSVIGKVYAPTYTSPTPSNLTTAIGSMESAYADAASRSSPDFNELATGNIGGKTLVPGLYTWSNTVTVPTNVTIAGSANDIWIFQIAGDLTMAAAKSVILAGGAQTKNIFWQVAGQVTIGAGSHFEGIILSKTAVTLMTQATLNGRIFAQSMVSLDDNAVTQP